MEGATMMLKLYLSLSAIREMYLRIIRYHGRISIKENLFMVLQEQRGAHPYDW